MAVNVDVDVGVDVDVDVGVEHDMHEKGGLARPHAVAGE